MRQDPFQEPCRSLLQQECGYYVHGCIRIFGTPTPQEFCESSVPDAEFCAQWIIVCEERAELCDAMIESAESCDPQYLCLDAWWACIEDDDALEPCWSELQACEAGAEPVCPESDGDDPPAPDDDGVCTCTKQLDACLDEEYSPKSPGECNGGDAPPSSE